MSQPKRSDDLETKRRLTELAGFSSMREARIMIAGGMQFSNALANGIHEMLSPQISLISGPGCPESAPMTREIDTILRLCQKRDTILTAFGDFLRVPGSSSSLAAEKAMGADIRPVDSAREALEIAANNRDRKVLFVGTGFEAVAPTVAATVLEAKRRSVKNFFVYSLHRMLTPALDAALSATDAEVDGVICPGHISAVIGSNAYLSISEKHGIPCVISGFSPTDLLHSIYMILKQLEKGQARVQIQFKSGVTFAGNRIALSTMERVFRPSNVKWRGLGMVPKGGLILRLEYKAFRAESLVDPADPAVHEHPQCVSGDIIAGRITPLGCTLFGGDCTPEHPIGPSMASPDGPCSAYHLYSSEYAAAPARSVA